MASRLVARLGSLSARQLLAGAPLAADENANFTESKHETQASARRLQTDVALDPLDAHPELVEIAIASRVRAREQLESALGRDPYRFDLYLEVIDVTAELLDFHLELSDLEF